MKVQYIDHMGNDNSVVNAARVSFAKEASNFTDEQNHKLIRYLAEHNHWSPFAHTAITLRMKAPIAIHAQMMKHAIGFAHNTVSRRYVSDTPEFLTPTFRHTPDGNVKQGSGEDIDKIYIAHINSFEKNIVNKQVLLPNDESGRLAQVKKLETDGYECTVVEYTQNHIKNHFDECMNNALRAYEYFLSIGVAPEQARLILPQGVLTEWVSTGSLYAWARFYNLRTDPHAQKEIQDLAKMVGEIIEPLYPVSWQALVGAKTSKPNNFNVGDTVIFHNYKYTILDVDLEKKLYKLDQHYYVGFTTIHKAMETHNG